MAAYLVHGLCGLLGIYFSYRVQQVAKPAMPWRCLLSKISLEAPILGLPTAWNPLSAGQPAGNRVATLAFQAGEKGTSLRGSAAFPYAATGHHRAKRDGGVAAQRFHTQFVRNEDPGFPAAPQICGAVSIGLRHSLLQHGNGRKFDHRIQHQHSAAKRSFRPLCALGLCCSSPR